MNTIIKSARGAFPGVCLVLASILFLALLCAPVPVQAGGPLPFTAMQFPTWWNCQPTSISVTGTVETIIYQTTIPANLLSTGGVLQGTYFLDGDGVNTNHIVTTYIGGTGTAQPPSGSTPLLTNTFTTTQGQPVTWFGIPNGTNNSIRMWASANTNSFNAVSTQPYTVNVGLNTNTLLLTITGKSVAAINTNWATLDAIVLEGVALP